MSTGARVWSWVQPVIAALCLVVAVGSWALQAAGEYEYLPSVQAVITASFVYPGLALSMAINHVIVGFRRRAVLSAPEKSLVVGQVIVALLLVITSLDSAALIAGFLLWPLLIVGAVSACAVMTSNTIRLRRDARHATDPRDSALLSSDPPTSQVSAVSSSR